MGVKSVATVKNRIISTLEKEGRMNWLYRYVVPCLSIDGLTDCRNVISYYKSVDDFIGGYLLCTLDDKTGIDIVETSEFVHYVLAMWKDRNALMRLNVINDCDGIHLGEINSEDILIAKINRIDKTEDKIDVYVEIVKKAEMDYGLNCPGWRLFLGSFNIFGFQHNPVNYDTLNIRRLNALTKEYSKIYNKCMKLWLGYINNIYTFDMINELVSYDAYLYALAIDYNLHKNEYVRKFSSTFLSLQGCRSLEDIVDAVRASMTYYSLVAPRRMWNAGLSVASMVDESFKALIKINFKNMQKYADIDSEYIRGWFNVRDRLDGGHTDTVNNLSKSDGRSLADREVYREEYERLDSLEQLKGQSVKGEVRLANHIFIPEVLKLDNIKQEYNITRYINSNTVKEYASKFDTKHSFVSGISMDIEASPELRLDILQGNIYGPLHENGVDDWYKCQAPGNIVIIDDVYTSRYMKLILLDDGCIVNDLDWMKSDCRIVLRVADCNKLGQVASKISGFYGIRVSGKITHTAIQHVYPDIERR